MRKCRTCSVEKEETEFYVSNKWHCKSCLILKTKLYVEANYEKTLAREKEYKRAKRRANGIPIKGTKPTCAKGHPRSARRPGRSDCAICHKEQERAKNRANGAKPRVKRTHCLAGHELVEGNLRKGRHKGQCLLCHRIRETGKYDQQARDYIKILVNDPCSYCGGPGGTIDHIIPRAKGGSNEWTNLTGACHSCNAQKHTTDLLQFLLRQKAKVR